MIGPHFKKCYYSIPSADAFPTSARFGIGTGMEHLNVFRLPEITDALDLMDEIDLWIFPDIGLGKWESFLRKQGCRVWGAGKAEKLEYDRLAFKQHAEKLGLDVGPYEVVRGMEALRSAIKSKGGRPVKIARYGPPGRGDFETIRPGYDYSQLEFILDDRERTLGHLAESVDFILEKPIDDAIELATDCYCIDGEYPSKGILGLEIKAEGFVGKVVDYVDYPESLREVNEALSPTFKRSKYRAQAAIECRLTKDGTAFVLDPCLRFGRPPLSIQSVISNWPEIFYGGGAGVLVEPVFVELWCAETCIYSDAAEKHTTRIEFPEELASQHLKLSNYCISKGKRIVIPQTYGLSGLGSVCATGPTMKKAIENVVELSKELSGYDTKCSFPEASVAEEVAKMREFGIDFG